MTVIMVTELTGIPGTTFKFTVGDTATTLLAQSATMMLSSGKVCIAVLITCETYDARISWGTNPVQGGVGHILGKGDSIRLINPAGIRDFRCINKTNGEDAVFHVTPEYSPI